MRIAITGGNGFLGRRVAAALAARGVEKDILLVDTVERPDPPAGCRQFVGDVADPLFLAEALPDDVTSIFHLAAVVSAEAEADYDLGMRVNVDGVRALIERCRALPHPPRWCPSPCPQQGRRRRRPASRVPSCASR